MATGGDLTRRVRAYRSNGEVVEHDMTESWARRIQRMDWAEERADKRYRAKHKSLSRKKLAGVSEADKAALRRAQMAKPCECADPGPFFHCGVLLGVSATWDGPDGWCVDFGADDAPDWRCRGCGNIRGDLPGGYYCLHCDRSGADWQIRLMTRGRRRVG